MYSRSVIVPEGSPTMNNKRSKTAKSQAASRPRKAKGPPNSRPIPIARDVRAGNQSMVGRHIERGMDLIVPSVAGSATFAAISYEINPGLTSRFASLSNAAKRADRYRFRSLRFRFVPSKAVTTTAGMVGLALELNPNSGAVQAQDKFQAYEFQSTRSAYSEAIEISVPQRLLSRERLVRIGPVPFNLTEYDPVSLVVAVLDEADTSKIGFVEVHYEIEFYGNQLTPDIVQPSSLAVFNLQLAAGVSTGAGELLDIFPLLLADTASSETVVNTLGGVGDTDSFVPGAGAYLVILELEFQNSANTIATTGQASLYVNGGNPSIPMYGRTAFSNGYTNMTLVGYVNLLCSDTLSVHVLLTAASGTLTVENDTTRILIKRI